MAKPDIQLGPGDTAPITRVTLYDPDVVNADGSVTAGPPINLQNADLTFKTVVCRHQVRDFSLASVNRTPTIKQTSPPTAPGLSDGALQGVVDVDWLISPGAVVPPGSDHNLRFIVTDNTGHQVTFPNGEDDPKADGTNPAFLWLQVSRDFVVVP